uniref:C-type lectin domain-containing protein n=1 Tax=Monopterus albus TaxID=43700 RepID=A0A3Q3IQL5_MONAL
MHGDRCPFCDSLCMRQVTNMCPTLSSSPRTIWVQFNFWHQSLALMVAVSMGPNLASVHSADEYHEIQKMIVTVTHMYREAWLGGSDAPQEGIWLWSDGTLFNYQHCGGFNNYQGQQHCLQINYRADNCSDDVWCTVELPFVCAKKP